MTRIVVTRRALAQMGDALASWTENRPAAAGLLENEFDGALDLLSHQPLLGFYPMTAVDSVLGIGMRTSGSSNDALHDGRWAHPGAPRAKFSASPG